VEAGKNLKPRYPAAPTSWSLVAQLTGLQETTKAVASTLELDRLLNLIVQQATTLLKADGGFINLVVRDKGVDEVFAVTGLAHLWWRAHSWRTACPVGYAAQSGGYLQSDPG
jgi:hypothetical protein